MSLFRSIFQGGTLSRADYDLPLYRTFQEPEAFPPEPIAKSVYVPKAPVHEHRATSPASIPRNDDMVILARRERYYQQKFQELLDAQSDGLSAGVEDFSTQAGDDDDASLKTPTQTTYSLRSGSVSPVPRERRRKLNLNQARRGIRKTLLDCAALKAEEDSVLTRELKANRSVLQQLEAWSAREEGLKEKITSIEQQDNSAKAEALKHEASKLASEIQELETRLAQMKTRHRRLLNDIEEVENSVSSRLSSYKASLDLLEKDVQAFLRNPPHTSVQDEKDSAFLKLPASRRTVELAKEHWRGEVDGLKRQRKGARREQEAMEEGAVVWQEVVAEVSKFQKYLREELQRMPPSLTSSNGKGKATDPSGSALGGTLERLDAVAQHIEEKLSEASRKQWRLLEVCIAAEYEALQQAREMLVSILGIGTQQSESVLLDTRDNEGSEEEEPTTNTSSARDMFASANEGLLKSNGAMSHSAALQKSMHDDDDDPDPELLFTRQADDTD